MTRALIAAAAALLGAGGCGAGSEERNYEAIAAEEDAACKAAGNCIERPDPKVIID